MQPQPFYPLSSEEFAPLRGISEETLREQLHTVAADCASFESWLGTPPADATNEDIQGKIKLWDTCRQWLYKYELAIALHEGRWEEHLAEAERRGREILGDGCPTCDAHFGCPCLQERIDAAVAEEMRERERLRQQILDHVRRGTCFCYLLPAETEGCDICLGYGDEEGEDSLRCTACGGLESHSPNCCGDCGGCSRCVGPDPYEDYPENAYDPHTDGPCPCGCGAPEEHSDFERYVC